MEPVTQTSEENALPDVGSGDILIPNSEINSPPLHFLIREDYRGWRRHAIQVPVGDRIHIARPKPAKDPASQLKGPREDCCVVAVAASVPDKPGAGQYSSLGIFHGKDNPKNFSILHEADKWNTIEIVLLAACHYALKDIPILQQEYEDEGRVLQLAVIKSDSRALRRRLDELLPKGKLSEEISEELNSWHITAEHDEVMGHIDHLLKQLGSRGTVVKIWYVQKRGNVEANELANLALKSKQRPE